MICSTENLVNIIVKLNGIVSNYENLSFAEIKRQIFEIKKNINFLLKELKGRWFVMIMDNSNVKDPYYLITQTPPKSCKG